MSAIGFLTPIGLHITKNQECAEWLINSTNRTDSSNFELFAIMLKIFGLGFPSGRLFLQSECSNDCSQSQHIEVAIIFDSC